jgi:hypothetical protein
MGHVRVSPRDASVDRSHDVRMKSRALRLLQLFIDKLRMDPGPATVLEAAPEDGYVVINFDGQLARLHLSERELLKLLSGARRAGRATWGERMSDVEAAARFLTIFLDESIETQEPDPSGWWVYEKRYGFSPVSAAELSDRRQISN